MSSRKKEPNYRALFVIGLSFTGAGISLAAAGLIITGISILAVGIVFIIVGITNRKKWVTPKSYEKGNSSKSEEIEQTDL